MKLFLVVTQVLFVLCLVPWFPIWGLSFMSFDMGYSVAGVVFVSGITLYPIAVLICSIIAWVLHQRKKQTAIVVNLIPMLWILGFGMVLFVN